MWKLFIMVVALEQTPVMMISHPFEFADQESCVAFSEEEWKYQAAQGFTIKGRCLEISKEV